MVKFLRVGVVVVVVTSISCTTSTTYISSADTSLSAMYC